MKRDKTGQLVGKKMMTAYQQKWNRYKEKK